MVLGVWAQNVPESVTSTYALTDVTVVKAPGQSQAGMTVIIKDGLIQAVGKNVKIPFDAKPIKADSMYVYAGFISGAAYVGVPKPKEEEQRRPRRSEIRNPNNPSNADAGIQPDRSVRDLLKADDKSIDELRKLGFTAAQVLPRGRMLPGKGSLIFLAGDNAKEMIAQEDISLFASFSGSSKGVYPSTVIAVMSKLRDLYHQAEQAKAHSETYANSSNGMRRPNTDPVMEAFFPLIDGKQRLHMRASNPKEVSRALALQEELGYKLGLYNLTQSLDYSPRLKDVDLYLSLALPKAKKEDKKKTAEEDEEKKEPTAAEKEMEMLEARRAKSMATREAYAKDLDAKGMAFGFSTAGVKAKDIRPNLKRMIDAGLSPDKALAALTTQPAKMLGIDDVVGTVEKGKVANLMVADAPYFEEGANVRYVFVDGKIFEYKAKPKKKKKTGEGDAADEAAIKKVEGDWTYNINAMGQQMNGKLTFDYEDGSWSGVMSDPTGEDDPTDLSDVEVDGSTITFTLDMQGMTIEFELEVDGTNYDGTASVGAMGSFEITGKRDPNF